MLQRTHHLFIEEAASRQGGFFLANLPDLLHGNDEEDVILVPGVGLRLRAAGLTHTQRPGGRFGELGFPSAKRRCELFLARAREQTEARRAANWFGRALHLLGDALVPARARGVWHLEGDPLEAYIEENVERWRGAEVPVVKVADPGELVEEVARFAVRFEADTTRTVWGRANKRWFGRGKVLETEEIAAQAKEIVPMGIAYAAALMRASGLDEMRMDKAPAFA